MFSAYFQEKSVSFVVHWKTETSSYCVYKEDNISKMLLQQGSVASNAIIYLRIYNQERQSFVLFQTMKRFVNYVSCCC